MNINKYLDDLSSRIEEETETKLLTEWKEFTSGSFSGEVFIPERNKKNPPGIEWLQIGVNEALADYQKMALQQFKSCSDILANGGGNILSVRCNYGTAILPSLFGVELFIMEEKLNTLPTNRPLVGGVEQIKEIIDTGTVDFEQGLGKKVLEMAHYYLELFSKYPEIEEHVYLYHPDLQGPMDVCELLWGSDLFLDIMDYPGLVHDFLQLITDTYIGFMDKWQKIVSPGDDYAVHWGLVHRGNIMLRNDSAMNFSPEMYDEFIKPYDQQLFDKFGGGAMHFCGRGDHYIKSLSEMEGIFAVNMSQPEYNDMDKIYENTIDKGIKLIGFSRDRALQEKKKNRKHLDNVQC